MDLEKLIGEVVRDLVPILARRIALKQAAEMMWRHPDYPLDLTGESLVKMATTIEKYLRSDEKKENALSES